ncbi:YraN family protein [Pollutimonas sp. M17]|uniref:YraN family protein n=1 Tax=Pollutimonas sp. M17 TaxID=2962065 RepID=UPI0021F466E9|nr:YraN family protein [Pollutimonas sp. M17]UYO93419.1 YraN family protein [Pollutimonas sp. M17]HWK71785.1 YraN family protein [Burkholderiaceae bacterium]
MTQDALAYALARLAQQKALRARRRRTKAARPCAQPWSGLAAFSPTQKAGRASEDRASRYLEDRGLTILGRNLRSKAGEIDLVALDNGVLAFIEVRHRNSRRYGGAAASVNRGKQARLIRAAQYFLPRLAQRHFRGAIPACRFDVVSDEPEGLIWIKDAFQS